MRGVKKLLLIVAVVVSVPALALIAVTVARALTATPPSRLSAPRAVEARAAAPAPPASCAFSAPDGSATAIVIGTGAVCSTLAAGLARDGSYWQPLGGVANASPEVCSLASGGSTLAVYDPTAVQEPITGGVASGVCAAEESNGWIPAEATPPRLQVPRSEPGLVVRGDISQPLQYGVYLPGPLGVTEQPRDHRADDGDDQGQERD